MKYLVSHQGQQSGPFAVEEIVRQVRAKELDLFDYIYDQDKDDWVLLMENASVAAKLKEGKPSRPPTKLSVVEEEPAQEAAPAPKPAPQPEKAAAAATKPQAAPSQNETPDEEPRFNVTAHTISEWFVLKGENRFGPFTYTEVIKMLQQKTVFPFDFVWHTGMENWKRVAEVADFAADNIRKLFSKTGKSKEEVFLQRRFKRRQYTGRVIIHDGASLWRGQGFEISKGGVGVTMQNTMVVPGQQLTVHFNGHDEWPAFNATCEVVSKKFVGAANAPVEYGLRFLSLSQEAQDEFYKKVA
jgi:hypothetical protein